MTVKWTERVSFEDVLKRIEKEKQLMRTVRHRRNNWLRQKN